MAIRILLADDNVAYRHTLKGLLDQAPDLQVVAEAGDGEAALRVASDLIPDIVVMDVVMPGVNGIEATRRVAALPSVRVLALSMHTDPAIVEGMMEAGAGGYAVKDSEAAELIRAVRLVAAGGTYLSPGLDGHVDLRGGKAS